MMRMFLLALALFSCVPEAHAESPAGEKRYDEMIKKQVRRSLRVSNSASPGVSSSLPTPPVAVFVQHPPDCQMPEQISLSGIVLVFNLKEQCFAGYEDGLMALRDTSGWRPEDATQPQVIGLEPITGRMSSGRVGYDTPTGVFTVLGMEQMHISREFDNVPMPFSVMFTERGHAIHAGNTTYGWASHGCIRLPYNTAQFLWEKFYVSDMRIVVASDRASIESVISTGNSVATQASN